MNIKHLMRTVCAGLFCLALSIPGTNDATAAEKGFGVYLLGSQGPQGGMLPPVSGLFSTNVVYMYSGEANPTRSLPIDGNLAVGVSADLVLGAPGLTWIPDAEIFGGRLALIGILPIGSNDVGVSALLNAGGVPIAGASLSQQRVSIGDPQLSAVLGWNSGAFSWKTGVMVNVPIGDYDSGRLDNIAFNRWAIDVNGGLTWLDPATGFELSGVAGFTFNGTNDVTNYQTGTEFHLELAAVKHVSPQVQLGMVGYYYNQISGDSGSGALLGAFKGEVAAIGPHFSWTIPFG